MNCIGHTFSNDKNSLSSLTSFLEEYTVCIKSKTPASNNNEISLKKIRISYTLSTPLKDENKLSMKDIPWIFNLSNNEVILDICDSFHPSDRIQSFLDILELYNIKAQNIIIEGSFFSCRTDCLYEVSMPLYDYHNLTNDELTELVLGS